LHNEETVLLAIYQAYVKQRDGLKVWPYDRS